MLARADGFVRSGRRARLELSSFSIAAKSDRTFTRLRLFRLGCEPLPKRSLMRGGKFIQPVMVALLGTQPSADLLRGVSKLPKDWRATVDEDGQYCFAVAL